MKFFSIALMLLGTLAAATPFIIELIRIDSEERLKGIVRWIERGRNQLTDRPLFKLIQVSSRNALKLVWMLRPFRLYTLAIIFSIVLVIPVVLIATPNFQNESRERIAERIEAVSQREVDLEPVMSAWCEADYFFHEYAALRGTDPDPIAVWQDYKAVLVSQRLRFLDANREIPRESLEALLRPLIVPLSGAARRCNGTGMSEYVIDLITQDSIARQTEDPALFQYMVNEYRTEGIALASERPRAPFFQYAQSVAEEYVWLSSWVRDQENSKRLVDAALYIMASESDISRTSQILRGCVAILLVILSFVISVFLLKRVGDANSLAPALTYVGLDLVASIVLAVTLVLSINAAPDIAAGIRNNQVSKLQQEERTRHWEAIREPMSGFQERVCEGPLASEPLTGALCAELSDRVAEVQYMIFEQSAVSRAFPSDGEPSWSLSEEIRLGEDFLDDYVSNVAERDFGRWFQEGGGLTLIFLPTLIALGNVLFSGLATITRVLSIVTFLPYLNYVLRTPEKAILRLSATMGLVGVIALFVYSLASLF